VASVHQGPLAGGEIQVGVHHHLNQRSEIHLGRPAQQAICLAGITVQVVHFRRSEVAPVSLDDIFPVQTDLPSHGIRKLTN
jgi:hypothetical protein